MMGGLYLFLGILMNAIASILMKIGSANFISFFNCQHSELIKTLPVLIGVICYMLALIFYILSLARLPLNIAHPVMTAGSIILVLSFSMIYLKEPFTLSMMLAIALLLIGLLLLIININ